MFYTYVLLSLKDKRYYIGSTEDLDRRVKRHNDGLVISTKNRRPLRLVYFERFSNRNDAYRRERKIKRMKGGVQFKKLVGSSNGHRKAGSRFAG